MNSIHESLSVQQVAALCGVNRNTVGYWCRSGKIRARRVGNRYAIPMKDLRFYLESTGRNLPEGLYSEDPQARIFKTIQSCWDYFRETPHGNGCENCRVFQKRLTTCFIARGLWTSERPKDCYECEYFRDIYLPRIQMIHQIAIPAFIYKDFHFWGGNKRGAELCGLEDREILGKGVEELVHRDSLEFLLSEFRMQDLKDPEFSGTFPIFFKNKNQRRIKVEASFCPLYDPERTWLVLANRKEERDHKP